MNCILSVVIKFLNILAYLITLSYKKDDYLLRPSQTVEVTEGNIVLRNQIVSLILFKYRTNLIEGLCFGEESFGCFNIILDSTSAWSGGIAILAVIGPSHLVLFSGNCKVTNDSGVWLKKNLQKMWLPLSRKFQTHRCFELIILN